MGSEGSPLLPIDGLKLACAEQHLTMRARSIQL